VNLALQFLILCSASAARFTLRAFSLLAKASRARLIVRKRLVAAVFVSIARTSLSPWDTIVVKRADMLCLSRQGQRLRVGLRQTRHAYLIQKPDLCRFVKVTAAQQYRILHMSGADS
jgi:hypothetical protein